MKARAIHLVLTQITTTRSIMVSNEYDASSKTVKGNTLPYYNTGGETRYYGTSYPITQLSDERFKDAMAESFGFKQRRYAKNVYPRIYEKVTLWMDKEYAFFMKDNEGKKYTREIELEYDDYVDFTSQQQLRKEGRMFLGEIKKKGVDLSIIYTSEGKTLICSKGEKRPIELPGIRLLKVVVLFNPKHVTNGPVEVELVYTTPSSDTEKKFELTLNYTPKKRFGGLK